MKTYQHNGEFKTIPEISLETGIPAYILRVRISKGLKDDDLISPVVTYEPIFYKGKFKSLSEIAKENNIYKTTLSRWIKNHNLTVEEAIQRKIRNKETIKAKKNGTYVKIKPQCDKLKNYPNAGGHILTCSICSNSLLKEYVIWLGIKARCFNKNDPAYPNYGGRGITMSEEWIGSFKNFYEDVGPRPSDEYSIDRYPNNNGNYEPGNCRWATRKEQARNRRNSKIVFYKNRSMTVAEAAELSNIDESCIRYRLNKGYPLDKLFEKSGDIKKKYLLDGKRVSLKEVARNTGISTDKLNLRMSRGMSLEEAIASCK